MTYTTNYINFSKIKKMAILEKRHSTNLRSNVNRTCSSFGDRTFAAAATRVWNSLPPDMRKPELSYGQFRRSLKTFLCRQ